MRTFLKKISLVTVLIASTVISGCSGNVGVGMSIGVPIGDHGYVSVGGSRWN